MRSSLVTRFILAGFLLAVLLGVVCLETLRSVNEASAIEGRRHMLMDMAATLESGPVTSTIHELKTREGRRGQPPGFWVFSGHGQVLAKSVDDSPAMPFEAMEKPQGVHDFTIQYRPFLILPQSLLLRLDSPEPTYLLVEMRRPHTALVAEWVQFAFFLFVLAISTLSAVSLIFIYIGRKSKEARAVLARLEKGDLKARFEISRFDGIGSLMFDFNRMAGEIERLVHRVQETESARKHLLEELSHDLRTPLTSLRNSIEALVAHGEEMTG